VEGGGGEKRRGGSEELSSQQRNTHRSDYLKEAGGGELYPEKGWKGDSYSIQIPAKEERSEIYLR